MEPKQPVSVDGIEFDALIDSEESYDGKVPEDPVDSGFSVSDTVTLNAMELSLTLFLTPTPITWRDRHASGIMRVQDVCDELLEKRDAREPLTIVTQNKTYKDMAILQISFKKTAESGYAMEIPVKFRQIHIANSETMAIPSSYLRSGKTQAKTGNATTRTISKKTTADTKGNSSSSGKGGSNSGSSGSVGSGSSGSGASGSKEVDLRQTSILKLGKDAISGIISQLKN